MRETTIAEELDQHKGRVSAVEEFEQFKRAIEMCIVAGFLTQKKFDEALAFVRDLK